MNPLEAPAQRHGEGASDASYPEHHETALGPLRPGLRRRQFYTTEARAPAEVVHQPGEHFGCSTLDGGIVHRVIETQAEHDVAFFCQGHDRLVEANSPEVQGERRVCACVTTQVWFDDVASFTITSQDDPRDVGCFVWTILETQGVPRVVASLDDDGLRRAVDGCYCGVGHGGARTLMEITQGNFEAAGTKIVSSEDAFGDDDPGVKFLRGRLQEALTNDG